MTATTPEPLSGSPQFVALPTDTKRFSYKGIDISKATVFRLIDAGIFKTVPFEVTPGSRRRRVFILASSIDAWIEKQLAASAR
ncbi:MAG: helix-turn-helix transcriptional regulator [Verrucomicrobiales bacterium]